MGGIPCPQLKCSTPSQLPAVTDGQIHRTRATDWSVWGKIKHFSSRLLSAALSVNDQKKQARMFCSQWLSATPKERISEMRFFFNAEDIMMSWRTCLFTFYKLCLVF